MARKFQFNWNKINEKLKKQDEKNNSSFERDERFYQLQKDESGKANVTIRFLPPKNENSLPRVKTYNHFFRDNNGMFVENCPTTIGENCPVCEANKKAWNVGDKKTASRRKRQLQYYSKIYIVKDKQNQENEGKVFLLKYGKQISEMINQKVSPDDEDEYINVFDYYDGANFRLKLSTKKIDDGNGGMKDMPTYETSYFESKSEFLGGDDKKLAKVHNEIYDLNQFIEKDAFKSYEELSSLFDYKIGKTDSYKKDDDDNEQSKTKEKTDESDDSSDMDDILDNDKEETKDSSDKNEKEDNKDDDDLNMIDDDEDLFKEIEED